MFDKNGEVTWKFGKRGGRGHQEEHHDLFRDFRAGQRPNEAEYGAMSTMTAILGRMCTYSGKEIKMADALKSEVVVSPIDQFTSMSDTPPVVPNDDMSYNIPVPGEFKVL